MRNQGGGKVALTKGQFNLGGGHKVRGYREGH